MNRLTTRERLAWAVLALLLLVPVWWGAHQPNAWDVDNIAPGSVLRAMAARFGPGWYSSYGPLPYQVTALLYAPMLLGMRLSGELGVPSSVYPWGFAHPGISVTALVLAARLLTIALALGVAVLLVRSARVDRHDGPAPRWWVPLILIGSPAFAYYARTTNVDLHYLFWLALGFWLVESPGARLVRLCGAAVAAAAAVSSKEQSAPLAATILLCALWRAARGGQPPSEALRRVLAVGACAAIAYALIWMLPFNLEGWRAHNHFVLHVARYPRAYPLTPAGMVAFGARFVQLLPVALGWPVLVGLAVALWLRPSIRGLGWRVLGVALYLAGFVAPVGYLYPRFLLPLLLLAVPLAARGLELGLERLPGTSWRALAITGLGLAMLTGAPNLSVVQLTDTRYAVARWLERALPPGGVLEIAGNPRFQAPPPAGARVLLTSPDALRAAPRLPMGDIVLLSDIDAIYFERDRVSRQVWLNALTGVGGDYNPAIVFAPSRPTGNVLSLFVSPRVRAYVRRPAAHGDRDSLVHPGTP